MEWKEIEVGVKYSLKRDDNIEQEVTVTEKLTGALRFFVLVEEFEHVVHIGYLHPLKKC